MKSFLVSWYPALGPLFMGVRATNTKLSAVIEMVRKVIIRI